MTANQISYAKLQEDIRSHLANEEIARRNAAAAEKQADVAEINAETQQWNAATNERNALINESGVGAQWYSAQRLAEYQTNVVAENLRHNQATEANTLYDLTNTANWRKYNTDIQAATSRYVADVNASTNLATNKETNKTNVKIEKMKIFNDAVKSLETGVRSLTSSLLGTKGLIGLAK